MAADDEHDARLLLVLLGVVAGLAAIAMVAGVLIARWLPLMLLSPLG